MKRQPLSKNKVFTAWLCVVAAAVIAAAVSAEKQALSFANEDFYTDGEFDVEKGRDAIVKLCEYHGYPIFPGFHPCSWSVSG